MILAKYIRLSSADEDARYGEKPESNSVTHQRMLLNRYLETHPEFNGCKVLEFQDDGRSGTNFDRPGVRAMLDAVRRREIDCVIVKDFSRFGRNYVEVGNYLEQVFPFLGVRFISVNDCYDSKDHPYGVAGDINNGLRNLINELYSRDLSQKVKDSRRQYARRGQCIAAYPVYGYMKSPEDRRKLIPDPEAAEVVRRVFDLCIGGMSPTQIARALNQDAVPTPSQRKRACGSKRQLWNDGRTDNEWNSTTITRILREEKYTGKLIGVKTTRTELGNQNSSKPQAKEDWIVVPGAFEAIVSQEVFDTAQKRLAEYNRPARGNKPSAVHLFSKKLKCGHCGLALGRRTPESGTYYKCEGQAWNSGDACRGTRLSEKELTRAVLSSIRFQAKLAQKLEIRLDRQEKTERRKQEEVWERQRRLRMKLEQLAAQKTEAFLLFDRGELSRNEYDDQCARLDKVILEQRMKLMSTGTEQDGVQVTDALECRRDIDELKDLSNLRKLDRAMVEKLIRTIRVYEGNRIEIIWNFSDSYMRLLINEEKKNAG